MRHPSRTGAAGASVAMGRWGALGCLLLAAASLGAACSESPPAAPPVPAEPSVSADLEPFLTSYFESWSRGDMKAYQDHFHPRAVIYMIKGGKVLSASPLEPFIQGQKMAQEHNRSRERMTSFRADEDRAAATVAVEWELISGDESTVGVDRFTLIRDEQWRWKILSLTFYATGRGSARP